ncbi:MAG: hypothetical protein KatS3mg088_254 [Patescibacteria group bacterium]|nr:MAG: hypothetical protein KatS3mg088_254 [Patescibacteria group bacterium]
MQIDNYEQDNSTSKEEIKYNNSKSYYQQKITIRLLSGLIILTTLTTTFFAYNYFQLKNKMDRNQSTKNELTIPTTPMLTTTPEVVTIEETPYPNSKNEDVLLEKIRIMSTENWKNVSNNGINFEIPPEASCNNESQCSIITYTWNYQGRNTTSYIYVKVENYTGGSIKEQFLSSHREVANCEPLYKEALFGGIKALQIAVNSTYCQGESGGIVSLIGNKLVIFEGLSYNPDTKEINRWSTRDTIISTLRAL